MPGDLVLNNQQAWRGSVGVSQYQGIISPAYVVLKLSDKLIPSYANYLFRSPAMVAQYVVASRGVGDIQRSLFYPDLRNSILRSRCHSTSKLPSNGFWTTQTNKSTTPSSPNGGLSDCSTEQKEVIVQAAVTHGLTPAVKRKPSGIPWLVDIPTHWEVLRAKYVFLRCLISVRQPAAKSNYPCRISLASHHEARRTSQCSRRSHT